MRRQLLAGFAAVAILSASVAGLGQATPAAAAGGSLLLDESFSGASVADPRAKALNDACLTAATGPGPGGSSNLAQCTRTVGSPTVGVSPGYLQLTDDTGGRTGGMVFDRALPSSAGVQVEFDQYQYGTDPNGADGISFFLSDGSRNLTDTGAFGGALGYAQGPAVGAVGGTAPSIPGVAGGYLGVGLDYYGNFLRDLGAVGHGCPTQSPYLGSKRNTVTLRGPGDGFDGYCMLATTVANDNSTLPGSLAGTDLATATRNVRVLVSPGDFPTVTVEIDFSGTRTNYQTVLSYVMTDKAPATYKFGFGASTGGNRNVHLVRNVAIRSVEDLGEISLVKQVDNTNPQPASYAEGDTIPYQFVVTNTGEEPITDVVVSDPLIANVVCPVTVLGAAGSPDSSMVCTGSLVVSPTQALSQSLVNTATVTALDSTAQPLTDTSTATVDIEPPAPSLTIEKSGVVDDVNGSGAADAGESIDYSFVLTNTGNITLTDVGVDDPKAGSVSCPQTTLAPGTSVTCTADASYIVTEQDVIDGEVVNTATGLATVPAGVDPIVRPTDTLTTPTASAVGSLAIDKAGALNDGNGNGLADLGRQLIIRLCSLTLEM
ncbi:hypothetical protein G7066_02370 [Leucobacter coleopterorum]|uniref:DUF7507 domain-containing protein n=1 Tax=Leucobacter coleopterorum TaxID=2714933 RepID=A0ABX6JUB3_9MICO|nr:hypothetical protein [Leucobacter coleopterorum]QIM17823.1 hypothetical protein G7066_02370 [Leucobacter coleopterorum]